MLTTALAAAAALVALAFAGCTFERWLVRRRAHDLSWSLSLLMFFIGAAALAYGATAGWNGPTFRVFYAFGAIINVPFLAAGQLQLQLRPHRAAPVLWGVSIFSALAVGIVLASPFIGPVGGTELPRGKEVFPVAPRILAAVGSGASAMIVFVGTVVGVIGVLRARRSGPMTTGASRRAAGLGLLALGTATLSASGTLNSRFGEMRAFSITLTAGVTLLFAGFLMSSGLPKIAAKDLALQTLG